MEPVEATGARNWSSIDIFLFSNGQQYSPPRKYHLRSEELQWWGATVSYLGRTQYGSGHSSIELYTMAGEKVNGPLELVNGTAYVAVEPPDTFMDAGYENYLLKATRSWEKRLAQKTYNTEMSTSENKDPKLDTAASENTTTNNKPPLPLVKDIITSPQKGSSSTKPQQLPKRKWIPSAKPVKKKNSTDTQSTTQKRTYAETEKICPCTRNSLLKTENIKRNRSSLPSPSKYCGRNSNQQQQTIFSKKPSIQTEEDRGKDVNEILPDTQTSNIAENLRYPLLPVNEELNLETVTEKKRFTNSTYLDEEHQTVISLYKNEALTPRLTDPENNVITNEPNLQYNNLSRDIAPNQAIQDTETIVKQIISNLYLNKLNQVNKCNHEHDGLSSIDNIGIKDGAPNFTSNNDTYKNHNKNKLYNETSFTDNSTNSNVNDRQVTDEYIACMNQGGLLFLKFHIKIKDCKMICNREKNYEVQKTAVDINCPKTEKMSQVNIDISFSGEFLDPSNEQYAQSSTLQSVLNKVKTEDTNAHYEGPKIILLKCPCHQSDKDYKYDNISSERQHEAKAKEIFNDISSCCECQTGAYGISKDDNTQDNEMKQFSVEDKYPSIPVTVGTRVKTLAQKFENSINIQSHKATVDNLPKISNSTSDDKQSMAITTVNNAPPSRTERNTESIIQEQNADSLKNNICDKSTQTSWSNILLEARRHGDDHYTFHLPSLHFLKLCKL